MKGKAIIKAVLHERAVTAEAFFGPGHPRLVVQARATAIQRMGAAGMSVCAIARVVRRDHTMVSYWLRPDFRVRRKRYYDEYWQRNNRGKRPRRDKVSAEQRADLLALHAAGEVAEVLRLQKIYGVSEKYTRELTSYLLRKEARSKDDRDLPLLAPVRSARTARLPDRVPAQVQA